MGRTRPRLYLDLDDVLLTSTGPVVHAAPHAAAFLCFAVQHFDLRWLTTHGRIGAPSTAPLHHLAPHLPDEVIDRIRHVEVAWWTTTKVEALDPAADFWWVDDAPLAYERSWLADRGLTDRLLIVRHGRGGMGLREVEGVLGEGVTAPPRSRGP